MIHSQKRDGKIAKEATKMWNDRRSLALSKCCVLLFMLLLIACIILAPRGYTMFDSLVSGGKKAHFLTTVYLGSIPAAALLILLYILLHRIGGGNVFVRENTECLRYISWCCFAGAAISLASSFYWLPWSAVCVASAFMGLIVRVIKNVVAKAVSLQDDADYTI